jgi:twitching motility protein PilJ
MASGTNYSQEYEQAEKAYISGNFDKAATVIDKMAEEFPQDPNVLLLRGHIYCYGFQDYQLALQLYELVLDTSEQQDLLEFARNGIDEVKKLQQQSGRSPANANEFDSIESEIGSTEVDNLSFDDNLTNDYFGLDDLDLNSGNIQPEEVKQSSPSGEYNPFETEVKDSDSGVAQSSHPQNNPFDSQIEGSSAITEETENTDITNANISLDDKSAFSDARGNLSVEEDEELTAFDNKNASDERNFNFNEDDDVQFDTLLTDSLSDRPLKSKSDGRESEPDWIKSQQNFENEEIDSSFFELADIEQELPDTGLFYTSTETSQTNPEADVINNTNSFIPGDTGFAESRSDNEVAINLKNSGDGPIDQSFTDRKGIVAKFTNAPIRKKQLILAGAAGVITTVTVAIAGLVSNGLAAKENSQKLPNPLPIALIGGLAGFGTSMFVGRLLAKQLESGTRDIQNQFEAVYQGNLDAKATAYTQDEIGQLALGFNRMMRVILTTTNEAQRRAEETEQAKEDLQRQVIRLLDDVEGAARGDLTVQATVTADVLGAVADAFNLTIQSLREIVRQVKQAAEQVNKSSTASEEFARNQSSDALRMAEELAVTLNSVQMMTESIERVAENAREAEEVARTSSVTALKGGQAVERTVAGIFQIRETVSETARKVKRLAEASQEISKIVLLISQIAERTNQLALNASIQAAKAGDAGRGFAVVADEVRQLADRSAKSLKEIEQIVLQIQSETGSVMTAMEEGIQEVIDVTNRAEQAKRALEDIIQVSNRIDTLVRSITADTVEQRENSRAVAQVMQSVELTAQETSQESQKVAGSLQNLVSIARNLLSSVERFRIDKGGDI